MLSLCQKTIPDNFTFELGEKIKYYCLLSLFRFVPLFFPPPLCSCLLCSRKHLIKNTISTTVGTVPSNLTIMGVYHALSLTGIYWDFSIHYLIIEWNLIAVSRGHLRSHLYLSARSDAEEAAAGKVRRDLSRAAEWAGYIPATDALPLFAVRAGMIFHLVALPLYVSLEHQGGAVSREPVFQQP